MNGFLAVLYYTFSPIITCPFSTLVVIMSVYVWSKTYSRKWDEKCFALHLDLCIQKQEWYRLLTHATTHTLPQHIFVNIVVWYGCVSRVEMVYGSLYFIKYCFLFIVLEAVATIFVIQTMANWTRSNNLAQRQQTRQYFPIFNQMNRNGAEGGLFASTTAYCTNLKEKLVRTCTRSANSCKKLWALYLWPCMLKCTSSAWCNAGYRQGVKYCKYISMRYLGGFGLGRNGHLRTNGHGSHNNDSMLTASSVDTPNNHYDEDEEEGISLLSMEEGSPRDDGNEDALSPNSNNSSGDDTGLNSGSYDDEDEDDKIDNNSYEHSDDTSTGASVITPAHPLLKEPFIGLSGLNMAWLIFISIQIYSLPAITDEGDYSDSTAAAMTNTTSTSTTTMARMLSYGIGHAVRNGALQSASGSIDTTPENTATGMPDINGDNNQVDGDDGGDLSEGYTKYTMTTTPYYILGIVPIYTAIAPLLFMLLMSNKVILPIPSISGLFKYLMSHLIYYCLGILLALDILDILPENDLFWTLCFLFDFTLLLLVSLWVNKEHLSSNLPSWNEDNNIVYNNTSHAPLRSDLPPSISANNNTGGRNSTPMCQEDYVFVLLPVLFENRYPRTFPAPLTLYPNSMIEVDIEPYDYNLPVEEGESDENGASLQQGVRRRGQGGGSGLSFDDNGLLSNGAGNGTSASNLKDDDSSIKDDRNSAKSSSPRKKEKKSKYGDCEEIPPPGSSDSGSGEYDDDDTGDDEDAMFSMGSQHVQLGRGSFVKSGHIHIGAHNQNDDDNDDDDDDDDDCGDVDGSFENVDLRTPGKAGKSPRSNKSKSKESKERRASQITLEDRNIEDQYFDGTLKK